MQQMPAQSIHILMQCRLSEKMTRSLKTSFVTAHTNQFGIA